MAAKVKVENISQVALVVNDLQASMENYWNILGIGPWDIYTFEAPFVSYYEYHGEPTQARAIVALTRVGKVQMELIEHLEGDTIYRDFLREQGEGLHHLQFLPDNAEKAVERLVKDGHFCLQRGRFGDTGLYAYMDMEPLHSIWEPVHLPANRGVLPDHYPAIEAPSKSRIRVTGIDKVAMVVRDIQKTAENHWNIFGIGPWDTYVYEAPFVTDFEYHGRSTQAGWRMASVRAGALQLELIEHLYGETTYRDHLDRHGEGLHHLSFSVEDVEETINILTEEGFPCLQRARFGNRGGYAYMDLKPLHAIVELTRQPETRAPAESFVLNLKNKPTS